MKDRPTSDHDRARLKGATKRAIERAGGGTAFAAQTRVEPPVLSKYAAPHEDHFVPVDVACDADMAAGSPVILSAMAATQGFRLVPIDDVAPAFSPTMVGQLIRETGDVSAAILEAMADGRVTPAERRAIEIEIDEALVALFTLRRAFGRPQ
ncbi:MAG: phage regulatory CII family protein [Mesorhizobium sp.]